MELKYFSFLLIFALTACSTPTPPPWVYPFGSASNTFFASKTSLELKELQTRKFNKSGYEVIKAIESDCKDRGGAFFNAGTYASCTFSNLGKTYAFFDYAQKIDFLGIKYKYEITDGSKQFQKYLRTMNIEDYPKDLNLSTIVRMRIYFDARGAGRNINLNSQITDINFYQSQFKKLADALFTNAIELNPQEMN
jgi:hypothetical protein